MRNLPIATLLLACFLNPARAQTVGTCSPSIGEAYLDVANVRARIMNNGNLFWRGSPHVYEVPKGGASNAIFASGIWIGGAVGRSLRLAGSTYGPYEFWAGPLDDSGLPPADCSVFDRVYKVGREDLIQFRENGRVTPDLRDWPTGLGAPTLDAKGNPVDLLSQPLAERIDRLINLDAGERPDIEGDQMLWWVMNDRGNVHNRTDMAPMGLEVHGSVYAFDTAGAVGNTTFHRYRLFHKGRVDLTSAYFGVFSDPDLGNFDDDYVGSDSVLGLAYVYNSDNFDEGGEGYGEAPPATGYHFLEVPGIPNSAEPEIDDEGVLIPDTKKRMTAFMFYSGGSGVTGDPGHGRDMYNLMQARWKDGQKITVGGNGRDFSNVKTNFMYSGNPPEFWSEFNSDRRGTAISPADRRFVSATGPFEIKRGSVSQVTFSITTSFGADNLDSVRQLKEDSRTIQAFFNSDFALPAPPAAPRITATARDREVLIQWSYLAEDNNYLDSYEATNPALSKSVPDRTYNLEGYNVFEFSSAADQEGRLLAVFDVKNGVKQVLEGNQLRVPVAFGSDSGLRHSFWRGGLTNYKSYYFGVQAYAYNEHSSPKAYMGPVARFEVVPTKVESPATDETLSLLAEAAENIAAGIGSIHAVEGESNVGTSSLSLNVINDTQLSGLDYEVEFIALPDTLGDGSRPDLSFDITRSDGTLVFDGRSSPLATPPVGIDVVRFDGLSLNVLTVEDGIRSFEIVSNFRGPIEPPTGAAPGWLGYPGPDPVRRGQQVTSPAAWIIVTGQSRLCPEDDCASYASFIQRSITDRGGWAEITPYDWEIRFTEHKSYAWDPWTSGSAIEVPFELWRTGVSSLDDPSDDVRMIPLINDIDANGRFNLLPADHPASPGPDDPFTDWFYWYLPLIDEPGDVGYQAWLSGAREGRGDELGPEAFGRMALMNWDGAMGQSAGLGVFNAYIPEPGTTFRIKTNSAVQAKDRFYLETSHLIRDDIPDPAPIRVGITPNPYIGASSYEVSSITDEVRFTNMPHEATVRIFQLSGALVRTLHKNSAERFMRWDLRTDNNLPIGSGMYLIHVESDGGDQIIKFGVVKKTVLLNTY